MIASTPFKHPVFTFGLPFEGKLNVKNRWVILANLIPWDKLADTYNDAMCANNGRLALPARLAMGALFVKHLLKISDEETILQIQENVYLQYFVGLEVFQEAPIFAPSLFVAIRKRLGKDGITAVENAIVDAMIADRTQGKVEQKNDEKPTDEPTKNEPTDDKPTAEPTKNEPTKNHSTKKQTNKKKVAKPKKATNIVLPPKKNLPHRGHLKIDTTVAPQKIKFPTDLDLLNTARQKSEKYIALLCTQLSLPRENYRTYRRIARKDYLKVAKMKRKTRKVLRAAIRKQLGYLNRNLLHIKELIGLVRASNPDAALKAWKTKDLAEYETIQTLYTQQKTMHDTQTNRCDNRIVSISQPYVRPIVRGKAHIGTEFGAKIAIATIDGISTVDNFSWNAYNENADLQAHIDRYTDRYQCYPELINCDKIYHTTANHQLAKHYDIRLVGTKLGRPKKIDQTPDAKREAQAERNQRNVIEGKIGQAKNRYGLDKIPAKTDTTSVVWTTCCLIATNLVRWLKDVSLCLKSKTYSYPHFYHFCTQLFALTKHKTHPQCITATF
jgi:hypothetical protein